MHRAPVNAAKLLILIALSSDLSAGTIGLSWYPSPGAAGYRVYYGTDPGKLNSMLDAGAAPDASLQGLADCRTWYFAVSAYNAAGESPKSAPVASWPRPEIASRNPQLAAQGSQFTLSLTGANFRSSATIGIDNPHVALGPASVQCGQITVPVTVEPTAAGLRAAEAGVFAVRVTNEPEGLQAVVPFEISIDPARLDVNRDVASTRDRLDGWDTILLAKRFGTCMIPASPAKVCSKDDPLYDPPADLDGDGWVDGDDLSLLGSLLGACWDGAAWSREACSGKGG